MSLARTRPLKIGLILPDTEGQMNGVTARWTDLLEMTRAAEAAGFDPGDARGKVGEACRAGAIGRFEPALSAAGHAADEAEGVGRRQPVAAGLLQHRCKPAGRDAENSAWRTAFFQHVAVRADRDGEAVRR